MIVPSPNDQTIGNPREYEGPVKALLRLTETAGFLHSTDGCLDEAASPRDGGAAWCGLGD